LTAQENVVLPLTLADGRVVRELLAPTADLVLDAIRELGTE
jgi:hypothetical protein